MLCRGRALFCGAGTIDRARPDDRDEPLRPHMEVRPHDGGDEDLAATVRLCPLRIIEVLPCGRGLQLDRAAQSFPTIDVERVAELTTDREQHRLSQAVERESRGADSWLPGVAEERLDRLLRRQK